MYYKWKVKEVLVKLSSTINGISDNEAANRLAIYGKNEIKKFKKISKIKLLLSQLKSFIVYVLLAAALISLIFGEFKDSLVILFVVIINTFLGYFQEYKAEKAIEALQKLSTPVATVIRFGKIKQIPSSELVPGDVIIIEEGSFIPADARVIESNELAIDESSLTGESVSVNKIVEEINKDCVISDQKNMVFSGTIAIRGRGRAVIINIGLSTELGKIAKGVEEEYEKETPLQKQLNLFGKKITISILFLILIIFVLGYANGNKLFDSFFIAVALAVAAIPEGLPAVITITLALGTQRMLKRNALVRKLSAVETLGSVNVICSDKTGTLTKNEMTVTKLYINNKFIDVTGSGYSKNGEFLYSGKRIADSEILRLLEISSMCNNSNFDGPSDPTEKALLFMSAKAKDIPKYERIKEIPFNSENKFMITEHKNKNKTISYMKGAPEVVLNKCKYAEMDNKYIKLDKEEKNKIHEAYKKMASEALRVLGMAYSENGKDFVFSGLAGMIDPPREEAIKSIEECKLAGIRVVMITGDYEITAKAIANKLGIEGEVINGEELEVISVTDLVRKLDFVSIFARVNPQHKIKIVEAFKSRGDIVAMTGDGVNDALALKKADIGVAIGSGTDVAKQASDIILLDDNFVTIAEAVKEGRGIYNNIKKFIKFLLSCNLAEVLVILLALIFGMPLPLIAIQILLVNLLTDVFPALALGVGPVDSDIMNNKPRNKDKNIMSNNEFFYMVFIAFIISGITLSLFYFYLSKIGLNYAQTVAFFALVVSQLFASFSFSLGNKSILSNALFKNKWLIVGILTSFILQLVIIYLFNDLFYTVDLLFIDLIYIVLISSLLLAVHQLMKGIFLQD